MVDPVTQLSAADAIKAQPSSTGPALSGWSAQAPAAPQADFGQASQLAQDLLSPPQRNVDEMRASLLSHVNSGDPIDTMLAMTDVSMEAQQMSLRYSLATGLTSAAVGLFGTLLKNNQ